MLTTYRRHNPVRCKLRARTDIKCKCPIWVAGTDADGHKVRESLKTRDWLRAQNIAREWDTTGQQPKALVRVLLTDLDTKFMQDATTRNLASETLRKYRLLFKQMSAFCQNKGHRFINELDADALREFRATWNDAPLSASKKLERLRSVFAFAMGNKWIPDNPALQLKPPKMKATPTLPFTDLEMDKILTAAEDTDVRVYAFILTMRYSGLRISDVTLLAVSSLEGNRLRLYTAKTGEHVSVLLPEFAAKVLHTVPHKNPNYFFWSGHSKTQAATSLWRKRLAKVFTAAKIEQAHSHRLRDTFAVALLSAGVSLEDVGVLLGHSNLKTTQKSYAPWVKSRQARLDTEIRRAWVGAKASSPGRNRGTKQVQKIRTA